MSDRPAADWPAGVDPLAVLGELPDVLALCTADGTLVWAGSNGPRVLGWNPAQVAGTSIFDFFAKQANHELHTADGRPVRINQGGEIIRELYT